jgi:hypothetical protein
MVLNADYMIHLAGAMLLKAMVSKRKEEIDYRQ